MSIRIFACSLAAVVAPGMTAAPRTAAAQAATGVIAGRVVGADLAPIVGARVRVVQGTGEPRDRVARTDSGGARGADADTTPDLAGPAGETDVAGRFVLRGVRTGVVQVEVRRLGYVTRLVPGVVVRAGAPTPLRVVLDPVAVTLGGIRVRSAFAPAIATSARPVSTTGFSAEQLRRAPGAQEDVVRALSVLPGVAVTTESRNDLVVRGGAPVETLFLVDGLEVPSVSHFGAQGSTGGATSLLPPEIVGQATLSAGGFGARYGDRASGVVDLALREGNRERTAGQLHVSALDAGAFAEGPLGGSGSFVVGARHSYLGPMLRALGAEFIPGLEDVTAKVVLRPSARDEVSIVAVAGRSTVALDSTTAGGRYAARDVVAPNETQAFAGATWRRGLARGNGRGSLTVTLGHTVQAFATEQNGAIYYGDAAELLFRARTAESESQLRATLAWTPGATDTTAPRGDPRAGVRWEVGTIAKYADRLHYAVTLPAFLRRDAAGDQRALATDTTYTAFRAGAYAQIDVPVAPNVRAAVGVRADDYAFLHAAVRVAPRASLTWTPDAASAVTLAGGRYWQAPQPIWLAGDSANRPDAATGGVRPFRADHLVLGWQRALRADLQLRIEAYTKWYADYPARVFRPRAVLQPGTFDNALTDIPFGLEPLASVGMGRVRGVELLVQKQRSATTAFGSIYGLAAVSLSRATFAALQGGTLPSAYDVPVVATLLTGWHPGGEGGVWDVSARTRSASGGPTTPFADDGPFYGQLDPARYAQGPRRTRFFSVDARVERRFPRRSGRSLTVYLEGEDLTNRHNWYAEEWDPYRRTSFRITTLGRLPNVGLDWTF